MRKELVGMHFFYVAKASVNKRIFKKRSLSKIEENKRILASILLQNLRAITEKALSPVRKELKRGENNDRKRSRSKNKRNISHIINFFCIFEKKIPTFMNSKLSINPQGQILTDTCRKQIKKYFTLKHFQNVTNCSCTAFLGTVLFVISKSKICLLYACNPVVYLSLS